MLAERFGWCSPSECFSQSGVEYVGDRFEIFGTVSGEICALGEVLTQQAISVFIRATLP